MSNKGGVSKEQAAAIARKAANMAVSKAEQQPKSKSKKAKAARKDGKKGPRAAGVVSAVVAHVNPFLIGARVRWPDEDATPSVAFRSRTIFNLDRVANTGGSVGGKYFFCRFVGDPKSAYNSTPTMTGAAPNLTWPITDIPTASDQAVAEYTSLESSFSRWRLVNWGVRIKGVGQVLTNQGTLYVLTVADQPNASYPVSPYVAAMRKSVVQLNGTGPDFVWISKPLDNTAREYREFGPSGPVSSWESLYIYSDDNAGSSPLMVEIIQNLELIPKSGDFSERLAQKAAPSDPSMLTSIMNTFQSMANVIMNNDKVQSAVSAAASHAVDFAAAQVAHRVGVAARMPNRIGGRPTYTVEEIQ